jgi:Domain of unknown function (DUF3291)
MKWHLAQANIGVAKYSYDDPRFAGFVDNLERINALADEAPGFVWRYVQDDEQEAGRDVFGDANVLFNMTMWESREALMDYVYKSDHVDILRQRAQWFIPQNRPILALWWQAAGTRPTVTEAKHRLARLAQTGPSGDAFTFGRYFEAPRDEEIAHG